MKRYGKIELAVGPMFSGKSEWAVSKLRAHTVAGDYILAIRYAGDNRYSDDSIVSHNGSRFVAQSASTVREIKQLISQNPKISVIVIDEMQFFDANLIEVVLELQSKGVQVYASGLDLDFTGKPWETTSAMMAIADVIEKKLAVCSVCKKINATRTQRLIKGKPASKRSPRVLIDGSDSYTARCILHHKVLK
jgi:thymidine kinase